MERQFGLMLSILFFYQTHLSLKGCHSLAEAFFQFDNAA